MQIANLNSTRNPHVTAADAGFGTRAKAGNICAYDNLTVYELEVFERSATADKEIVGLLRDKWLPIADAVKLAKDIARRINKNGAYLKILHERGTHVDGATCSNLLRIMENRDAVLKWYDPLPASDKFKWSTPKSIINNYPAFKVEKEQRRAAMPRKPTRLENALEENVALKTEIERHRRNTGDDYGFSRKDRVADIAGVLTRGLSEPKQRGVMLELVRKLGTRAQREAFGLKGDDQPASPVAAADGAAS